ncbi:MAG: hypothetical protein WC895_05615 [Candidatus Shapirobacteria bacterium]
MAKRYGERQKISIDLKIKSFFVLLLVIARGKTTKSVAALNLLIGKPE